jgi:CBS-domain-containing membrane protein
MIAPEATLTDAAALMLAHQVRHLPVVDAASNVVGMLSDRDLRTAIGDPVQYVELRARRPDSSTHVKDAMSRPAVIVPYDRPLLELARSFADDRLGAVLVADGFGALLGIVSYVDVLRVLTA